MATQVIIVDDDPIVGALTLELLKDAGYTTRLLNDSLKAQALIKEEKPQLVVLDILMPGLDGLTLLHRLKSDPETATIKIVVVSGKSFEAERLRALQYGAEAFIEKPYDVDHFAEKVTAIMTAQGVQPVQAARPPAGPPPESRVPFQAVVWGCRSMSSAVSPMASRYGKHTSCVSVETPDHLFIFDAGSGLGLLGHDLVKTGRHKELWLFLTHFHPDHVEGLAGFPCLRDADYMLNISGASDPDRPLENAVRETLQPGFGDEMPAAKLELYELMEQTYEILPGVRLAAFFANHPGTTLGFILQTEGRKIVYCPDSEIYGDHVTALQDYDEKLGGACRGADLMFHDGRYTVQDYAANHNAGHSSFAAVVDFAGRNQVKELVLVHQDERYTDDILDQMGRDAQAMIERADYKLRVSIGREGLRLSV